MIISIKLCLKHKGRINRFHNVRFSPRYNAVIGPNGSGKSSLLRAIYQCDNCIIKSSPDTTVHLFESETMNPHRFEDSFRGPVGSMIKVRSMFSSHGETMRDVLKNIPFKKGDCFLLDEPESGHDLEWMHKIRKGLNRLARQGCQIIAVSHHPVFWRGAERISLAKYYDLKLEREYQKMFCR